MRQPPLLCACPLVHVPRPCSLAHMSPALANTAALPKYLLASLTLMPPAHCPGACPQAALNQKPRLWQPLLCHTLATHAQTAPTPSCFHPVKQRFQVIRRCARICRVYSNPCQCPRCATQPCRCHCSGSCCSCNTRQSASAADYKHTLPRPSPLQSVVLVAASATSNMIANHAKEAALSCNATSVLVHSRHQHSSEMQARHIAMAASGCCCRHTKV